MNLELFILILIVLVITIIFLIWKILNLHGKFTEFKNVKTEELHNLKLHYTELSNQAQIKAANAEKESSTQFNRELAELKDQHIADLKREYEKGYLMGIKVSSIEIKITPIKRHKKIKGFFKSTESIEIGYKYQLFSNGIPCLVTHEEIIEEMLDEHINEENVKMIMDKLEKLLENVNPNIKLTESINSFGQSLLNKRN